jgi:hypothetical protein
MAQLVLGPSKTFFPWARTALDKFVFLSGLRGCRLRPLVYLFPQNYRHSRLLPASPVIKSRTTTTPLPAIRCSQPPSLTLPAHPTMHKFNLIVLSLLFVLSVTAAAPEQPEQAMVKRKSPSSDAAEGCGFNCLVSVDFVYARHLEPTEPLVVISIIHLNAD